MLAGNENINRRLRKATSSNVFSKESTVTERGVRFLLTYNHIRYMVIWMKTTLNLDDSVMALLKREAARRGCTMTDLMESALRLLLASKTSPRPLTPLPSFKSGGARVEVADRETLYDAMEGR